MQKNSLLDWAQAKLLLNSRPLALALGPMLQNFFDKTDGAVK